MIPVVFTYKNRLPYDTIKGVLLGFVNLIKSGACDENMEQFAYNRLARRLAFI